MKLYLLKARKYAGPVLAGVVVVCILALMGACADTQIREQTERSKQNERSREQKADDRPNFTSWQLDYGLYAFTYEGHLYFWEMDGFLLHAESCPSRDHFE